MESAFTLNILYTWRKSGAVLQKERVLVGATDLAGDRADSIVSLLMLENNFSGVCQERFRVIPPAKSSHTFLTAPEKEAGPAILLLFYRQL